MSSQRSAMPVSVVIITRNRPQMLHACLEHLLQQAYRPFEVVVVDSSSNEQSQAVLEEFPVVKRVRIPDGRNNMPEARNQGIARVCGGVIAFLDDDSLARPDWLHHLVKPYSNPAVGGVGGRVVDALEQARATPDDPRVGAIERGGKMTTNFILDTDHPVEVDHVRGCNMSFRCAALEEIGGFDPRYLGSNVCEETDVCVRVKQAGWKLIYEPSAVVDHQAAPREDIVRGTGHMIDPRSVLWSAHNRAYLFFKTFGCNYWTAKHILGGMQLLYVSLLTGDPSWARLRAAVLYAVGAWWGLADSLIVREHRELEAGTRA